MEAEGSRAHEDLEFVRRALTRDVPSPLPRSVALLWAALSLVGFVLIDSRPSWAPAFWLVASPVGTGISIWLGRRAARASGREDRAATVRWIAHWVGFFGALALLAVTAAAGRLGWGSVASIVVLVLALTYYTAGIHMQPGLLPISALLAGGYLLVLFVEGRHWTWIGIALAAALTATAFVRTADRRA